MQNSAPVNVRDIPGLVTDNPNPHADGQAAVVKADGTVEILKLDPVPNITNGNAWGHSGINAMRTMRALCATLGGVRMSLRDAIHKGPKAEPPKQVRYIVEDADRPPRQTLKARRKELAKRLKARKADKKTLIQMQWQNPADPNDRELVAQAKLSGIGGRENVGKWAGLVLERRKQDRPEGWHPVVCTDKDPRFIIAKRVMAAAAMLLLMFFAGCSSTKYDREPTPMELAAAINQNDSAVMEHIRGIRARLDKIEQVEPTAPVAKSEFAGVTVHVGVIVTEKNAACDRFKEVDGPLLAAQGAEIVYHDNYGGSEAYPFFDIVADGKHLPGRFTGKLTPEGLRAILKHGRACE